jgi:hypothetical protein
MIRFVLFVAWRWRPLTIFYGVVHLPHIPRRNAATKKIKKFQKYSNGEVDS